MMRNLNLIALIVIALLTSSSGNRNMQNDEEQFIEGLLAKMTLAEKEGQLNQYTSRWEMTGPAPKFNAGAF